MIDTHAHLTDSLFADDLPLVLQRAKEQGIHTIVCMSQDSDDALSVLRLHEQYPIQIRVAIGLHPEHATRLAPDALDTELSRLSALADAHADSIVAIGEVGLDYTPRILSCGPVPSSSSLSLPVSTMTSSGQKEKDLAKKTQITAFNAQISIASRMNLPLSVHSRGAGHHALRLLDEHDCSSSTRACMHAFDGRAVHAERALNFCSSEGGIYFSVPPSVIRVDGFAKLVRRLPLERLMLESDSPALPACAGTRNEPKEIVRALNMIAELKGCSVEHARGTLQRNTIDLFNRLEEQPSMEP